MDDNAPTNLVNNTVPIYSTWFIFLLDVTGLKEGSDWKPDFKNVCQTPVVELQSRPPTLYNNNVPDDSVHHREWDLWHFI